MPTSIDTPVPVPVPDRLTSGDPVAYIAPMATRKACESAIGLLCKWCRNV